jgi:hypothetical protein
MIPLYDIRPQGFLGRQFALAEHEQLGVSPNAEEWSDDDIVFVLSRAGTDAIGNLLLGDAAYQRWLQSKLAPAEPVTEAELGEHYAKRAQDALLAGVAGSGAGGEFPKFTAMRQKGLRRPHVLVKFSGAAGAPRSSAGPTSARTRVKNHAGRVFLEAERFDREGVHGRLPVCTLDSLNAAFLGAGTTDWTRLSAQLDRRALLEPGIVQAVEHLWWFGRLVANTDMHLANLSFHVAPKLRLAPAYDMLRWHTRRCPVAKYRHATLVRHCLYRRNAPPGKPPLRPRWRFGDAPVWTGACARRSKRFVPPMPRQSNMRRHASEVTWNGRYTRKGNAERGSAVVTVLTQTGV